MPAEILDTPQPTPHPDLPSNPGKIRAEIPAPRLEPQPIEPVDPDDPTYDSCLDDLNLVLSQPISEPDPVLKSKFSTEDETHSPQANVPVPPVVQDQGKQPSTGELFKTLGPPADEVAPRAARARAVFFSVLTSILPRPKGSRGPDPAGHGRSGKVLAGQPEGGDSAARDDDQLAESRLTWFFLLVLSYSSAVTLALFWVLWTGRTFRPAEPTTNDSRQTSAESNPSSSPPTPSQPLPPIPAENQTTLGKPIRIGELEVTPRAVVSAPVELVRKIEPPDYRREDGDSLVLRFKVTNISKDHVIAPLDRDLIRDQTSPLDRSLIVTSGGRPISLFPLAVDSEWLIQGQEFPVLKPGESAEILVASESITDDRMAGEMSWRLRLRTGPYRTDMLGVRFTKDDVSP
ncbi:MAG: hypothetical protein ACHRXM_17425 [Isosphaerales bacterium]